MSRFTCVAAGRWRRTSRLGQACRMSQPDIPAYSDLLWPTIVALRRLGGSGSIDEIADAVMDQEGFPEEQQQVLHGDGPQTEIEYRLAWAEATSRAWDCSSTASGAYGA
jgi:Mrr N-terminal domain